ncbi:MAG TPA: DUF4260 domain-containing protein [Cytophagaceae bacterium]
MSTLLKLEELAMFMVSYILTIVLGYSWWLFWALLLLPDVSMLGYLINTRIGAYLYNLFHHKGVAIIVALSGYYLSSDGLLLAGIILFGHSAMDRVFGYGLKHIDNFKNTHLGWIGDGKN